MIADLARLVWLAAVTAALLRAFGAGRRGVQADPAAAVAHAGRAFLMCALVVNVLSHLHVFNAAMFLAAWMAWPLLRLLKRHGWAPERAMRGAIRSAVLAATRRFEERDALPRPLHLPRAVPARLRAAGLLIEGTLDRLRGIRLAKAAAAVGIVAAAIDLRFGPVLGEPRLSSPQLYATLLATREAVFNSPQGVIDGGATVTAALSAIASINPIHVVRLIGPVVSLTLTLSGALFVRLLTGSSAAALATLAGLAIPWAGGGVETAALFFVLAGIAGVRRSAATRAAIMSAGAAGAVALGAGATRAEVTTALPIALAIAAGPALAALFAAARRVASLRLEALVWPAACLLVVLLIPESPRAMYLEHRVAQEKALEIAADRPRGRWLIVAPVEQLAEAYGRGWYEDPAAFVDRFAARAGSPSFQFEYAVDELFVFVEKRPFHVYEREPASVPFATLVDPTYRHYRSGAGRASLQMRLLALCRTYAASHSGVSLYYDDDVLSVYRVRLRD
jgi:hypothetical protein